MSKYFSDKYADLVAYTPGEQPKERKYIKLNTNESPFPPAPAVKQAVLQAAENLQLYCDPESSKLNGAIADFYGVKKENVITGNGSDEILNFAVQAYCDKNTPLVFPDITYGFYPVFARLNGVPYREIPLKEDFTVDVEKFLGCKGTVVIANPNAPTGIALPLVEIEKILSFNKENVVIIDEAYVDFGGESALKLIDKYDNLLVVRTFSKSRSLAGGRLGFGLANKDLIQDLNTVRYSTNPYNVNAMTQAAGIESVKDGAYFYRNIKTVIENREYTKTALEKLGFEVLDSKTNFLFVKKDGLDGEEYYNALRARGILVRHFKAERIKKFNRVTVGTKEEMDAFIAATKEIINKE